MKIATQAPSGSNSQGWHFVIVTDPKSREEIGKLYRKGAAEYFSSGPGKMPIENNPKSSRSRLRESAIYLVENIDKVPVFVIPCHRGRPDGVPASEQAGFWLSIIPAAWSFALAARARGLGTAVTIFHLEFEEEAAKILGIPYKEVTQTALIPLAYTKGTKFRLGPRKEATSIIHWDRW